MTRQTDNQTRGVETARRRNCSITRWAPQVLGIFVLMGLLWAASLSPLWAQAGPEGSDGVWGKIDHYTNEFAVVDGTRYHFGQNVVIDTYSLKPDKRGNVRVVLDAQGKVAQLFFHGLDMPVVIEQFKR